MAEPDISRIRIDRSKTASRKTRNRRYLYLVLPVLVIVGAALLYRNGMLQPSVEVQVMPVQRVFPSQTLTLLNASGYVVAQRKAAVASKVTGLLAELRVEEGDKVRKGQVIARLDNEDAKANRARAEANVHLARSRLEHAKAELVDASLDYGRNKELASRGYVAKSALDVAEARHKKATAEVSAQQASIRASEAALAEADVLLDYTFIRAPFDAVVLTKNADVGDIVTPLGAAANAKAAVVTIADMDSLMVEVDVSESNIERVKTGQPCEIRLDALPDTRFRGAVHMIVPTADRTKASVMVKIAFLEKSPLVLPEMSAKVAFLSRELSEDERKPFSGVPSSVLRKRGQDASVFVIREGRAVEKRLRIGRYFDGTAEVLEGLEPGEKVIASDPANLREGDRVKVKEK